MRTNNRTVLIFLLVVFNCIVSLHAQQPATLTTAGATCTTTSSACLILSINQNQGGATFTVTSNASGNTIVFEASGDGGQSWVALNATPSNDTTAATSTTGTGTWQANVAGYTHVRMRMSVLSSGSTTVQITTSNASARAGGGGGGGGGTIGGSIAANQVAFGSGANAIQGSNNFTYTSGLAQLTGLGSGTFSPASAPSLMNFQITNFTTGTRGWNVTNASATGSASKLSELLGYVDNNGIATIVGGNAVGDGSGNYSGVAFDGNPSIYGAASVPGGMGVAMIDNPNSDGQVPVTIGNLRTTTTADLIDIVKAPIGLVAGFDSSANFFLNGATSGTAKIGVAAVAGTPNQINLPTATGTANQVLQTDGNNPQQTRWATPTALSCSYQSPLGAVTGTAAAATYYTCSVPALAASTGISIIAVSKHTTGTAAVSYTVQFGGTSTTNSQPAGSANQIEVIRCLLMNNNGSTSAQTVTTQFEDSNAGTITTTLNTMAINTTTAQTLNIQFNVANTDQITPEQFLVQLVQ